jgi:hypothetical protein
MTVMNNEDPADPSVHEPKCDRCGAPVTTGLMAMMCPHARQCVFVDGDEHWEIVEEMRVDFGIERVKLPNQN